MFRKRGSRVGYLSGPKGTHNLIRMQCLGKGGAGLDIWGSSCPVGTHNLMRIQCLGKGGALQGWIFGGAVAQWEHII